MGSVKIEGLSFTYPNSSKKALDNINLEVNTGEFVVICGESGCGKTTLLRHLKPSITPNGELKGNVFINNKNLFNMDIKEEASIIGFVMQSPDNQIVTDKVWHELAFGLENLGYSTEEIRIRVSEMASFFGISQWFYKDVNTLSGGQKQMLNLASVMVMQPDILVLDEATSQLDPISARDFLKALESINRELGTTIIISEHRLEELFAISHRVVVMDKGRIIADSTPGNVGGLIKGHNMYEALPTPIRVYGMVDNDLECPVTSREGRLWIEAYSETKELNNDLIPKPKVCEGTPLIEAADLWFKYDKNQPDVIKGLNLKINKGEIFALLGDNGAGKTTVLSILSNLEIPYRGKVAIDGENVGKIKKLYGNKIGMLPQNPQTVFTMKTVYDDLSEALSEKELAEEKKTEVIKDVVSLCRIEDVLERHPYDLSGGEQQRTALAKILLIKPEILFLDEPTKGLDAHFKGILADILSELKAEGITVVMVSHDIEFCAEYTDRCALMFDGKITSIGEPRGFFSGKSFYTTAANKMARTRLKDAVLAEDIVLACGGKINQRKMTEKKELVIANNEDKAVLKKKKLSVIRMVFGIIFAAAFIITAMATMTEVNIFKLKSINSNLLQVISIVMLAMSLFFFISQKETENIRKLENKKSSVWGIVLSILFILIAVPFTIYAGIKFLGDRRYFLISILIILETMIPCFVRFETKGVQARELVLISVMIAIGVAGRSAFFMLPQFKPVIAIIIISGICFGGETGFLIGTITAFVSNFFFGQGSWTPWQMLGFGMVGFLGGILFNSVLNKTKGSLAVFGFIATVFVYGIIVNSSFVFQTQTNPTLKMFITAWLGGLPYDIVHGVSTAFFLWFISKPMIEKIERVRIKYEI